MFQGTTPAEGVSLIRQLLQGKAKDTDIYVGCSGNYRVDGALSRDGYKVHSNDVSLYSKAIADILLGKETDAECKDPVLKEIFDGWQESKYKKLVEIMFCMRVAEFAEQKNYYQQFNFGLLLDENKNYYERTIAKLGKGSLDFKIQNFSFCDFRKHLESCVDGVGICFPPTYRGGYEKMFQFVENVFDYERAEYDVFDPKQFPEICLKFLEGGEFIFYNDKCFEQLGKYYVGKIGMPNTKKDIHFYSSVKDERRYYFFVKEKPLVSNIPIIETEYKFTRDTKIVIEECDVSDVDYYKAFYMAAKVNYQLGGSWGLAFYADGKCFGFASFNVMYSHDNMIECVSDYVVKHSQQKLSKLPIMLLRSRDVRLLLARISLRYWDGIRTPVFTDSPVSMKYRGVYNLEKREKGKLVYSTQFVEKSISEIYNEWSKKYINE